MATFTLESGLDTVLGPKAAAALKRAFMMLTVGDLLAHYPRRYAKPGELTMVVGLPIGEPVTIVAEVLAVRERKMQARRGSILEVKIGDGHGVMMLTFFNQAWRQKELRPGARGIFAGKVGVYKGALQLAHPAYALFDATDEHAELAAVERAKHPIPIYPATASIPSWQLQQHIALALDGLESVPDPLPAELRARRRLLPADRALWQVHRPENFGQIDDAQRTLRMHEALVLQAALLQQREQVRRLEATARPVRPGGLRARFDARLQFTLTSDQLAVGEQIADDLVAPWPMNRLVQGEVGSGKTLVALRAMLQVADSGGQSALIAPTEVLASQHLRSIARMLGPELAAELMPTLLTGQMPAAERRKAALRVASGQSLIVVGTHALLSKSTTFAELALVVIDEQHRFGVEQRKTLRRKGTSPHALVLTATPIPRTVAMTVFGDLDVSAIHTMPAGRAGTETHVVPLAEKPGWMPRVWRRIAEEVALGRQAFIVCPAIDALAGLLDDTGDLPPDEDTVTVAEAEASGVGGGSAEATGAPLGALPRAMPLVGVVQIAEIVATLPEFANIRTAVLHGKLPAEEKDRIMRAFAAREIDVLIATTVVEVGVDVPNASTMAILNADRFGVSQLHQLRGRVGRGAVPGLCLLVTGAEHGTPARDRVMAVASTLNGFELAEVDLEQRREGDVLGDLQSGGRSSLRLLRVVKDAQLIVEARGEAEAILAADPTLAEHPALAGAIELRLNHTERAALAKN